MATFSVEFLGCKVSQTDAQALRERLAADGHREAAGGAEVHVVNGCCVTHDGSVLHEPTRELLKGQA